MACWDCFSQSFLVSSGLQLWMTGHQPLTAPADVSHADEPGVQLAGGFGFGAPAASSAASQQAALTPSFGFGAPAASSAVATATPAASTPSFGFGAPATSSPAGGCLSRHRDWQGPALSAMLTMRCTKAIRALDEAICPFWIGGEHGWHIIP